MKRSCSCPLLVAAAVAFVAFFSFSLSSAEAEINVPKDYPRIQDAINAAVAAGGGDTVVVEPGTYQETLTMADGVEVRGVETARTFLSGIGSSPIVTVSNAITGAISNFTFLTASVGVQVSNNPSAFDITNCVFEVGVAGTGIVVQNSPAVGIINNVFYNIGTAISSDADIDIVNNIFANIQVVPISSPTVTSVKIRYNDFFSNLGTGPTGTGALYVNPLFVDEAHHDFHLQGITEGDPFIAPNTIDGFTASMGAYGGLFADMIPFPVSGLAITAKTDTSLSLTWLPNNSYAVTDGGGYRVWYGYAPGSYDGEDAVNGLSPIGDISTAGYTLDLDPSARVPLGPILDQPVPGDTTLALAWTPVEGATGYKVHYGMQVTGENTIDAGEATTYTIPGLKNGQSYVVAVSAYALPVYYIAVTAIDFAAVQDFERDPEHESVYSQELSTQAGPLLESPLSNERTEYPDTTQAYPGLKGSHNGCFIATAAYGSYSAPEVLALRSFRDRYLLATAPGRLFVRAYYEYSPAAAALLNAHPAFKPAVRAALMPAVGAAIFLTDTSLPVKAAVLLLAGCIMAFVLMSKRRGQDHQ